MSKKLSTTQELSLLRSAVAGLIGRDREGQYRPELVAELIASLEDAPTHTFSSEQRFLEDLEKVT